MPEDGQTKSNNMSICDYIYQKIQEGMKIFRFHFWSWVDEEFVEVFEFITIFLINT